MSKNVNELNDKQLAVIAHLLDGKTQSEAATAVGIAAETISRWKRNDAHFVTVLNEQRRYLAHSHVAALQRLQLTAVRELHELITSEYTPAADKLQAIKVALSARVPDLQPIDAAETSISEPRVKQALDKRKRLTMGEQIEAAF